MKTMKKNYQLMIKTVLAVCIVSMFVTSLKANDIPNNFNVSESISLDFRNPVYQELLNKMNAGECFSLNSTAVTVRSNKGQLYSYTSYSKGSLKIGASTETNLVSGDIKTAFSDRSNFAGKKDIQSIRFNTRGNGVVAQITLRSWGNSNVQLQNLQINKKSFGYFITGNTTDGRSTTYYTFGIYKSSCLL